MEINTERAHLIIEGLVNDLESTNLCKLEDSLKGYKVGGPNNLIKNPYLGEEDIDLEYCYALPFTGRSNKRFKKALDFVWQCFPEGVKEFANKARVNIAALILVLFLNRIPSQFWVILIEGIFVNFFDFIEEFNLLLISKAVKEREKQVKQRIKQLRKIKKNAVSLLKELPALKLHTSHQYFNKRWAEELKRLAGEVLREKPYAIKKISEQEFSKSISLVSDYIKRVFPLREEEIAQEVLLDILERVDFELELLEDLPSKSRSKIPRSEMRFFEKFFYDMVNTIKDIIQHFCTKELESCKDWKLWDKLQSGPWKEFLILNPAGMYPNEVHLSKKRLSLLLSDFIRVLFHFPLSREACVKCNLECGQSNREAEADVIRKILDQLNPEDTFLCKL